MHTRGGGGGRYVSRGGVQTRGRISRYLEDKGCFRRSSKIAKGTLKRCSLLLTLCLYIYVSLSLSLAISATTSRLPSAHPLLSPPTRIDSYVRDVFSRRWIGGTGIPPLDGEEGEGGDPADLGRM